MLRLTFQMTGGACKKKLACGVCPPSVTSRGGFNVGKLTDCSLDISLLKVTIVVNVACCCVAPVDTLQGDRNAETISSPV